MATVTVNIGDYRIWLTTYNPADELSLLYAHYAAVRAAELLANMPTKSVHAWLRKNMPESGPLLDRVEAGEPPPRVTPPGQFPVTPGHEQRELPIIEVLRRRQAERLGRSCA